MAWKRWLPPVLAASVVAALAAALLRPNSGPSSPLIGKPVPAFTLVTLSGQSLSLGGQGGGPAVINFWASWCVPCREEAPLLREFAQKARNVRVVGVIFQDQPEAARAFEQEFAIPYPSVLDPQSRTAIDFGVAGVPETFFIDAQGIVQAKQSGPLTRDSLRLNARKIGAQF